jgi:hypothetical protein
MSRTDTTRRTLQNTRRATRDNVTSTRQPRPAPRRQGTRAGNIRSAIREP